MNEAEQQHRTTALANEIVDRLNREAAEGHVANVLTALQHVVANVLATYGIPEEVFFARVAASIEVHYMLIRLSPSKGVRQ